MQQEPNNEFDEFAVAVFAEGKKIGHVSKDYSYQVTTYLDELDAVHDTNRFIPPNPPRQSLGAMWRAVKRAVNRWFHRRYHEDDGAAL